MKALIFLSLILVLSNACSSVRSKYFSGTKKFPSLKTSDAINNKYDLKEKSLRFSDTTYIIIGEPALSETKESSSLESQFSRAVSHFDNEQYEKACPSFEQLKGILTSPDSLYFECSFYHSECLIMSNNLDVAEAQLKELLAQTDTPRSVLEKSIVRLGQLYCVTNRKDEAEKLFSMLKNDYPQSMYIKISNCGAVE